MKKLLVILSLVLVLAAILSLTVFAQAQEQEQSPCQGCEVCNPTGEDSIDEMPPMKIRIDGAAFLSSLVLMGKGMIGIFVVTLVIVAVVVILNWHGKSLEDRRNKNNK